MDKESQKKLLKDLEEEKVRLEEELSTIANKNPSIEGDWKAKHNSSDSSDTFDEKAHSVADYEKNRALEHDLETRLAEINDAIEKINSGKYGDCVNCSSQIPKKRLMAIPTAKFCVDCAEKATLA
ncbi:MAG: hypothetical protein COV29_02795 [Candidatus Yanofskybacteria bacterium CG10_big_fil_rev_8_21_14_0_10_36_16]|uniref:Zinc finger DksA/TraR C4-type domain-containing protein n=1 Tax=Candidatus Yanofskybacteria bacterium CG10_big_fil_rev_8_21_14_0_10_36_16 TaxID=1975096 RepID=A0A2J0Q7W9_9BACT|nr:MAG: hypothetical protein COV29_02795 [Candidatus Yanofskybacteria bacterium CG10_big_fil_rev_8_21_14_0_10_36_16]